LAPRGWAILGAARPRSGDPPPSCRFERSSAVLSRSSGPPPRGRGNRHRDLPPAVGGPRRGRGTSRRVATAGTSRRLPAVGRFPRHRTRTSPRVGTIPHPRSDGPVRARGGAAARSGSRAPSRSGRFFFERCALACVEEGGRSRPRGGRDVSLVVSARQPKSYRYLSRRLLRLAAAVCGVGTRQLVERPRERPAVVFYSLARFHEPPVLRFSSSSRVVASRAFARATRRASGPRGQRKERSPTPEPRDALRPLLSNFPPPGISRRRPVRSSRMFRAVRVPHRRGFHRFESIYSCRPGTWRTSGPASW